MIPKKILYINLSQKTAEIRLLPELVPFIGGVAMGVKLFSLYREADPIVVCIGPLNGYFPFASKTCLVVEKDGVIEDLYIGGTLSFRLAFSGVDALVIAGAGAENVILDIINDHVKFLDATADFNSLGLPGKRSILKMNDGSLTLDDYFKVTAGILEEKFISKKLLGFCVTGSKNFKIKESHKFNILYKEILDQARAMEVDFFDNPSCSGCPMGCRGSQKGEMGGNILLHSLVACGYAENIYSNLGTVFACLDCLGYKYTHEGLESLPDLFSKTIKDIT